MRGSTSPQTYASLRRDIVTGELSTETPLLEGRLADLYGVSRTPIREALRRLEQDGLVERGDRGYRVRSYGPAEVYDIYEARILLEAHAAGRAAERHREVDAWRMKQAHGELMSMHADAEPHERVTANQRFHRAIWESAGNTTVLEMLTRLYLHLVRHTTLTDPDRWKAVGDEHARLLEAILKRDAADAERLMAEHIGHGRDLTLSRATEARDPLG